MDSTKVSAEMLNTSFIDKIEGGMIKEAADASTAYIREKLREEGFLRRLFEPETITADDLDPNVDSDKPRKIVEKDFTSEKATFVPFKGTGDRQYFEGNRFSIDFGKVESDRVSKSKYELMTYKMPVYDLFKEYNVKIMQKEEDGNFMESIGDIITNNSSAQSTSIASSSNTIKDAFIAGMKGLTSLQLPIGKVLMNKNTYFDSLSLKTDDISYAPQEKRFYEGVEGEDSFLGYPVITTIKSDLVPENELFFFAPQEYMLKFYLIQDATMYMKSEADMLTFWSYEAPGIGIGNTKGVYKVTLT